MLKVFWMELKRTLRRKASLLVFFLVPVLVVLVSLFFLQAYNLQIVKIGIYNEDKSLWAMLLMRFIRSVLRQENIVTLGEDYEDLLKKGEINAVIVIPKGFSAKLYSKQQADMLFIPSPVDLHLSTTIFKVLDSVLADFQGSAFFDPRVLQYIFTASDYPTPRLVMKNPNLKFSDLIFPFVVFFTSILVVVSTSCVSTFLDRENKLNEMFLLYNLRWWEYSTGKVLAHAFLGFVISASAYVFAALVMRSYVNPSIVLFLITNVAFLYSSIGFLISALSTDKSMANLLGISLIGLSLFSSGFLMPVTALSGPIKQLLMITPVFKTMYLVREYQINGVVPLHEAYGIAIWTLTFFILAIFAGKMVIRRR